MPNDTWHKHFGFIALTALMAYLVGSQSIGIKEALSLSDSFIYLICTVGGFLFSIYMLNPDTFTPSASQNNWGPLKFIWGNRLYRFAHHGISHSPLLWVSPIFILVGMVYWQIVFPSHNLHMIACALLGVSINSELHLVCDFIMIVMHKSRLPVLKNI